MIVVRAALSGIILFGALPLLQLLPR